MEFRFLKKGFTREDLLRIDEKDLPVLAEEVRAVIINTVKKKRRSFRLVIGSC